ncbi:MAG: MoxR family ATPase [candidate division WOR-3 bacterium]|nr:MoxR family ATPase [candidate division WOR-3 bacterium]MDH5683197.1 MoxR family ATPase [candidate division WOR-3 bacterium]
MNGKNSDIETVRQLNLARKKIEQEINKVIVGQKEVIEQILICVLASGHGLIIGVPGLAKTLMVNTLAKVLKLAFNRIQFTPDLMPSDITGTEIIEEDTGSGHRKFRFVKGPIFANIILADEINRTPPKTQAALLQAMQEYNVTIGGETHPLPLPFFVLATQNPIELEGTYPLPEAQLDRFMFSIYIDYPSPNEEVEIVKSTTSAYEPKLDAVLNDKEIIQLQKLLRRVPVSDDVLSYAVRLASSTRPNNNDTPQFIKDWVSWGAGPRASQYLILGAKTHSILRGRYTPTTDDIRLVAQPVLRHRIVTNFNAEAEGIKADDVVKKLLETL